jgi:two-component system sensor histidine kinase DesK
MSTPQSRYAEVEPDLEEIAQMWGGGWRRYFFPAFWLVYLGQAGGGIADRHGGLTAVTGYVLITVFAAVYLAALPMGWGRNSRVFWALFALDVALAAAVSYLGHEDGLVCCVYLAVLCVAARTRATLPLVIGLTVASGVLPRFVPGWSGDIAWDNALSVLLVSLAMYGFFKIVQSNIALAAARAEVARLAAENERTRIARDLHDLLGHSLTTITVKAGLARRLAERGDATRALAEIAEVEQLSRRTLGEVRAAVAGHRDVTIAGELATAREVLRASGIIAELPGSVDGVDAGLSEVFGWVVREGVTNVVRHSRAGHCRIELGPRSLEIADDGRGAFVGAGNGLTGLRERLASVGGTLTTSATLSGFRLRAEGPAQEPLAAEPTAVEPAAATTSPHNRSAALHDSAGSSSG